LGQHQHLDIYDEAFGLARLYHALEQQACERRCYTTAHLLLRADS
ncbi:MAG: hypothetical protein ACI9UU_003628, partial [Candidatus Azotimanducaceae bacterium]